jgi:glucan phosphorylase
VLRSATIGDNDLSKAGKLTWPPLRREPGHMLVPGYDTETLNIIRLWQARAGRESFDLALFNAGHYAEAVEAQMRSENLTTVLYPGDSTPACGVSEVCLGRELQRCATGQRQAMMIGCVLPSAVSDLRAAVRLSG